jgi:hypothetical protein
VGFRGKVKVCSLACILNTKREEANTRIRPRSRLPKSPSPFSFLQLESKQCIVGQRGSLSRSSSREKRAMADTDEAHTSRSGSNTSVFVVEPQSRRSTGVEVTPSPPCDRHTVPGPSNNKSNTKQLQHRQRQLLQTEPSNKNHSHPIFLFANDGDDKGKDQQDTHFGLRRYQQLQRSGGCTCKKSRCVCVRAARLLLFMTGVV